VVASVASLGDFTTEPLSSSLKYMLLHYATKSSLVVPKYRSCVGVVRPPHSAALLLHVLLWIVSQIFMTLHDSKADN
jgi:hypothetical protein